MLITITANEGTELKYNITDCEADNTLLSLWLDGKAEKTIITYIQDV